MIVHDCMVKFVRPALNQYRSKIESWHFLWESKPWPSTLRLRFFANDDVIEELRTFLDEELKETSHCYGRHGECEKEYEGEADDWGTKAWEQGIRFLELGSEFALELIENKEKLGNSDEYKKDAFFYADRYTHLFLNQITSLVDEPDFYLTQGIFRFACQIGKGISGSKMNSLVDGTKQKIRSNC